MIIGPISDFTIRAQAIRILNAGGVVAVPTETVYGLAARLDSAAGIEKIFEAKGRPKTDPLIVHVASIEQAQKLCQKLPSEIIVMLENMWPGPLTLVVPKQEQVSSQITAGQDTVALRMPNHPDLLSLIKECGNALVAPSANRFGRISPTRPEHVLSELAGRIDMLLEGGTCSIGIESTILLADLQAKVFKILRPGGADLEKLKHFCPWPMINSTQNPIKDPITPHHMALAADSTLSPGQFFSHYAPQIPLIYGHHFSDFFTSQIKKLSLQNYGFLAWNEQQKQDWSDFCERENMASPFIVGIISPQNNIKQMAANFYHALRDADENLSQQVSLNKTDCKILLANVPQNFSTSQENNLYSGLLDRVLKSSSMKWDETLGFIPKVSPDYFFSGNIASK